MKLVLPYDASPGVRRLISSFDSELARIVLLDERDGTGLRQEIADPDVLLHVLAPVTAEIMLAAPKLRLIQKIGVGVDAIDLAFARDLSINVCNMPGTNTVAVAELALALMFAALRRLNALDRDLRGGSGWPAEAAHLDAVGEISGATVGLVGYGAVAKRLRKALEALGANVIVHTRRVPDDGATCVPLSNLLAASDIVSLHLPLTAETRGLMDFGRLTSMKPGAILINTARGALIDEAALSTALLRGHISAAGLDVFEHEPLTSASPLLELPNVVVTPHVAWMTPGTWRRSLGIIAENCRRLAKGSPLLHQVGGGPS